MIYTLMVFFIIGILIGMLFDVFRILRKLFKTSNLITYIEDALFWILTCLFIIYGLITFAYGEIRLYTIIMIINGTIIYFLCFSKYIVTVNVKIFTTIKKLITKIFKKFSKSSGK